MTETLMISILSAIVTLGGGVLLLRRDKVKSAAAVASAKAAADAAIAAAKATADADAEATVTVQKTTTKAENDKLIDQRIADELDRIYTRLEAQDGEIEELREALRALGDAEANTRRENLSIRAIVTAWFRELRRWDQSGRRGHMPLPSPENMALLDLPPYTAPSTTLVPTPDKE
jgi:hypothetical protein